MLRPFFWLLAPARRNKPTEESVLQISNRILAHLMNK